LRASANDARVGGRSLAAKFAADGKEYVEAHPQKDGFMGFFDWLRP
jgi:hypothetical protein